MRRLDHSFLKKIPIAHRGYHTSGIPENSLLSAENAIRHGYAIELDIRVTRDGQIIVFHDEYAKRCLGLEGRIGQYTYDQIKDIDLLGFKGVHVPLFSEFLAYVNGRVPLLIELKACFGAKHFVDNVVKMLRAYHGEFAIQTFNPFDLIKLKKIAPEIIRGQLITKDLSEMPRETSATASAISSSGCSASRASIGFPIPIFITSTSVATASIRSGTPSATCSPSW